MTNNTMINLVFIGPGIFCLWLITLVLVMLSAESDCLAFGYPHVNVSMNMTAYCTKRIDQTDVVVPLAKLKEQK